MCSKTVDSLRWHDEERSKDGNLRRPTDGLAWKDFDRLHPYFALDCRNVRLSLSSDGFNPFQTMSISHNTWPVMLMMYNCSLGCAWNLNILQFLYLYLGCDHLEIRWYLLKTIDRWAKIIIGFWGWNIWCFKNSNISNAGNFYVDNEQEVNNQPQRYKWSKAKNHCQNFSQWFETSALQDDVPYL